LQSTSSEHDGTARIGAARVPWTTAPLAALESLRPYQWLKNVLVFVPLVAAHRLGELDRLGPTVRTFLAFCLCASAIYLVNDVLDADADRRHPHKRLRPIASGRLGQRAALALAGLLVLIAASVALPLGAPVVGTLALYIVLMIAYSIRLKTVVLLDAFVLAGGYALRVIAGGLAIRMLPSARLLAFCAFLFVSLALVKRYTELVLLSAYDGPATHARSYEFKDRELIMMVGVAAGVLSVLVLALFLIEGRAELRYSRSQLIWGTCVLLLYWISHVWLAAHRGRMTDDPVVFAVKDRVSLTLIALMGVTAWLSV